MASLWRRFLDGDGEAGPLVECPVCHGKRVDWGPYPRYRKIDVKVYGRHNDYITTKRIPVDPPKCQLCNGRHRVSPEQARQASYFGAIAISRTLGTCGYSWGYAREDEAQDRARTEAGDPAADVLNGYGHYFMALTQDTQGIYHSAYSYTQDIANQRALQAAGRGARLIISFDTRDGPAD